MAGPESGSSGRSQSLCGLWQVTGRESWGKVPERMEKPALLVPDSFRHSCMQGSFPGTGPACALVYVTEKCAISPFSLILTIPFLQVPETSWVGSLHFLFL